MDSIKKYAAQYARDAENNFAVACHDQNSTQELLDSLDALPDPSDEKSWGLVAGEWRAAIVAALRERGHDVI